MNLASRFPIDLVAPDLGPKMYIAHASSEVKGTTKLHLDLTDAVATLHVDALMSGEYYDLCCW